MREVDEIINRFKKRFDGELILQYKNPEHKPNWPKNRKYLVKVVTKEIEEFIRWELWEYKKGKE